MTCKTKGSYKRKGGKRGRTLKRKGGKRGGTYKRRRGSRKIKGGAAGSAAAFGELVYNGPKQQHAQPGTNVISENYIQNA